MTYDHWKTTNPADEFLGPEPDEEMNMLDHEIVTRRDLMIARAIEAQEHAAQAAWYAKNCADRNNHSYEISDVAYLIRAAQWQQTAKLAHDVQASCVQCLLHCSEDWLDQGI